MRIDLRAVAADADEDDAVAKASAFADTLSIDDRETPRGLSSA